MTIRCLITSASLVLLIAGCSHGVHLQADHGGFLTDEEIRPLDAVAQSTAATEQTVPDGSVLPEYVFAFAPDFEINKVTSIRVLPFTALTKDGEDIARDIAPAVISRAARNNIIPSALTSTAGIAPEEYVLSGAVTRTIGGDGSTVVFNYLHETASQCGCLKTITSSG